MILEVVRFKIREGTDVQFAKGMSAASRLFEQAPGCLGIRVVKSIEEPQVIFSFAMWKTIEDHTEKFQKSAAYQELFALIGDFIDGEVSASHCDYILDRSWA